MHVKSTLSYQVASGKTERHQPAHLMHDFTKLVASEDVLQGLPGRSCRYGTQNRHPVSGLARKAR